MKSLILFSIFFLNFNSYSSDLNSSKTNFLNELNSVINSVTNPPDGGCHNCQVEDNTISQGDPLPTEHRRDGKYFNKDCQMFITEDGKEGVWGQMITEYIENESGAAEMFLYDEIKGMTAAPYTCPNWYNLNNEQRKRFWVWMFASIAQVESSCDPTKVNTGRVPDATDRPTGLFQLNRKKDARYWRGKNCQFASGYETTIEPRNQVRCSMDIMYDILLAKKGIYKANGKIFPTNSYWEKLRPNHSQTGGPIGELARMYPPCNATP
ncbi:hypothetical protein [Halobacteriovorax sp. DA5]|uniref:hypothetical protein n=1 Tax=Halobacteriovorax sp. DA5 TaxID=2067553 RepID=UPI000CD245F8|nr:hypothetical protein [Halobacteriovorax sp. DA5]POB12696.1 hypothetical protein C0Z22_14045 [Halobacteriovorax sp. DA5]